MSNRTLSILVAALSFALVGEAAANSKCGGLNQRVCKKWEQLRGCDPGLHRTSPIGGICTYDNKLIPDSIERIIAPAPVPAPQPEPPLVELPPAAPNPPGHYTPPTPPQKKGALPHLSAIPPSQPSAMDGLWKLEFGGLPFKLEAGRMYSMSDYMHLLIFPVETYDVVVKDITQTGPGTLSGQDLVLVGRWTGTLQADGTIALQVQGVLGHFTSKLTPISLADPQWFQQELASLSGGYAPPLDGFPSVPGATPQPAPGDGGIEYPPGWGN